MAEPEVNEKRKGGAEKLRIKKQIMLKNEAKNCSNILNIKHVFKLYACSYSIIIFCTLVQFSTLNS